MKTIDGKRMPACQKVNRLIVVPELFIFGAKDRSTQNLTFNTLHKFNNSKNAKQTERLKNTQKPIYSHFGIL